MRKIFSLFLVFILLSVTVTCYGQTDSRMSSDRFHTDFEDRYDLTKNDLDYTELDYDDVYEVTSKADMLQYIQRCFDKCYRYIFFASEVNYDLEFNDTVWSYFGVNGAWALKLTTQKDRYIYGFRIDHTDSFNILAAVKNNSYLDLTEKQKIVLKQAIEFVLSIKDLSTFDKEVAIHDYICDRMVYSNDSNLDDILSCYGGLVLGRGNCQAYADSFNLLCGLAGIKSGNVGVVENSGSHHRINYVVLDGKYYFVDCTFDDSIGDNENGCVHFYLNAPASMINTLGQVKYIAFDPVEEIDENYYYVKKNLYFDSNDSVREYMTNLLSTWEKGDDPLDFDVLIYQTGKTISVPNITREILGDRGHGFFDLKFPGISKYFIVNCRIR